MYRQHQLKMSQMETVQEGMNPQIIARVTSLPLVHSACDQICSLYMQTKEKHDLIKYTLETAENGVKTVATSAMPIVNKLEKPISALDGLACNGLDKLEQKVPLIKEPTDKVYGDTIKPYVDYSVQTMTSAKDYSVNKVNAAKDTITSVKTYSIDTVNLAKDYSVNTANDVTSYTYSKIDNVKQYSMEKLETAKTYGLQKVQEALETPTGKVATQHIDNLLNNAEQYMDYYLPEAEGAEKDTSEEKTVAAESTVAPIHRAYSLSTKARQRLSARALRDLKNVQLRTKDALDKLHFNVDLIQYAKTNVDNVRSTCSSMSSKLADIWTEINADEEEAEKLNMDSEDKATATHAFEKRAIATARHLTLKVKTGVSYLSSSVHLMPATVTDRVANLKKYSDDLYNSFSSAQTLKEIPDKLLIQAKERLSYLQETFTFVSDYLQTTNFLNWMGLQGKQEDIEMEALEQPAAPEQAESAPEQPVVESAVESTPEEATTESLAEESME